MSGVLKGGGRRVDGEGFEAAGRATVLCLIRFMFDNIGFHLETNSYFNYVQNIRCTFISSLVLERCTGGNKIQNKT